MSNPHATTLTYTERKGGAYVRDSPEGEIRKVEPPVESPSEAPEEPTTDPEPSDEDGNE